eukprot:GFYU01001696.1.p1 GENE.GFYU01001696.1~~GFYU01001696.1.p1  ORF type:complete len:212 (-),score=35.29 GFYU01001696.1:420-1055(-)
MPREDWDDDDAEDLARRHGWQYLDHDNHQCLIRFGKHVGDDRFLISCWWSTGTVGTYLKHPRQGKTQLFRKKVGRSVLGQIFSNPRHHTGTGYHTTEKRSQCPLCGKYQKNEIGTASHYESGGCSTCRDPAQARRNAYNLINQSGFSQYTSGMLLEDGRGGSGYVDGGQNYACPSCNATFKQFNGLLSHTAARPQCNRGNGRMPHMAIGYQ